MSPCDEQEPIAIIGTACRLPGEATSVGRLWDMISHGRSAHGKVPSSRWDADVWYHPDPDRKGSISVKHGYFLEQDISVFDAPFFSMTAKEAAGMDPMKRLLLEVSYEGFENAGIAIGDLTNSQTGVYVGCMTSDYEQLSTHDIFDVGDGLVAGVNLILHPNFMHQLSSMHMLSPEGISHSFDHRANGYGRGEGIACIVVKRLRDALRDGDTIRAVIRGTGTNADGKTPGITQPSAEAQAELIRSTYEKAGLLYSDTQYFEAHGTGTPLGDPIELSAIGATLGTGRSPESGPLYVGSIKANVGHTEGCSGLAGVLKSILCLEKGMLIPTAGVEKVNPKLKLAEWNLALPLENMAWPSQGQRRISVNSFGFGGANAHVILDDAYNYLRNRGLQGTHTTTVSEDDSSESGISMGSDSPRQENIKRLFTLSTRDQATIERLAQSYGDFLSNKEATSSPRFLSDFAYTLSERRTHLEFRSFAVAESAIDLQNQLNKGLAKPKRAAKHENPIFVFTGQGAQWPAMGKELLNNCIFRTSIHRSQALLEHYGCPWDLIDELSRTNESNLDLPQYSQVLCTVLQIALVDLLREWGVRPRAVVGHSSGEIGAAYAAGLLSRCNAVKIAYLRGICSAKVTDAVAPRVGAMAAAGLSEEEAAKYIEQVPFDSVVVACVNSPSSVTLSGDQDAVTKLCSAISADGKFARLLRVKTAYHSPHMATVAQEYHNNMGNIIPLDEAEQVCPMFSSLTGGTVTSKDLDASYWMKNMCEQVRFSPAMTALLEHTPETAQSRGHKRIQWSAFIEIGPHGALQSPVSEIVKESQSKPAKEAPYLSVIVRNKDAEMTALQLAGQLWSSGHSINLLRVNCIYPESLPLSLPDLPSYPWNHSKSYWHESAMAQSARFPGGPRTDLLGVPVDLQNPMEPRWRNYLRISENPWIEDHKITGTVLYPAAGMIVMALEAACKLQDNSRQLKGIGFQDLKFERGLVVPSREHGVQTEVSLRPDEALPSTWKFAVYSLLSKGSWTKHCHGTVSLEYEKDEQYSAAPSEEKWRVLTSDWKDLKHKDSHEIEMEDFYDQLESVGVEYGPTFRNVFQAGAVTGEHCAHGCISIPDTKSSMPFDFEYPHLIHPATMDAIFHLLFIAFSDGKPLQDAAVPYTLKHMYIAADLPQGEGGVFSGYAKRLRSDGHLEIIRDFALRQVTSSQHSSPSSDKAATKVCAKLRWKEDIDFIRSSASLLDTDQDHCGKVVELACDNKVLTALAKLLDMLHHKRPGYEMLVVMQDASDDSRHFLKAVLDIFERVTRRKERKLHIVTTSEAADSLAGELSPTRDGLSEIRTWNPMSHEQPPFSSESFDFIVSIRSNHHDYVSFGRSTLPALRDLIRSTGYLCLAGLDHLSSTLSHDDESMVLIAKMEPRIFLSDTTSKMTLVVVNKSTFSSLDSLPSEVFLLHRPDPPPATKHLVDILTEKLKLFGGKVTLASMSDVDRLKGKYIISLLEVDSPLVYDWDAQSFDTFKRLVSNASQILWITRGGLMQCWKEGLEFAPTQGLLRVMRTEYSQVKLQHLDLSRASNLSASNTASVISNIWCDSTQEGSARHDMEYAEFDGRVFVPRFVEDESMDADLRNSERILGSEKGTLNGRKNLTLIREGSESVWVNESESPTPLLDGDVEITVELALARATPVSEGTPGNTVCFAIVGTVSATPSLEMTTKVGQRVIAIHSGPCRTSVHVPESLVRSISSSLPPEEVLTTYYSFFATGFALIQTARLESGMTVLIRGADSPFSRAAIRRAQGIGAEVFVAVKISNATDLAATEMGVDQGHVHDDDCDSCVAEILRQTQNRGVDVILNCHPGEIDPNWIECLCDFGTFISMEPGASGIALSLVASRHNATFVSLDVSHLFKSKPKLAKRLFDETCELLETEDLIPPDPRSVKSVSDVDDIVSRIDGGEAPSDIILKFDTHAQVLLRHAKLPELQLDNHGTYILAGGLGALGLKIANMMFDHGAGHVVFLSRSGGKNNSADLDCFRQRGLAIDALKCDVSISSQVDEVVRHLQGQGRRIRGVIQCAMVLEVSYSDGEVTYWFESTVLTTAYQDAIFENMTYDQWQRSTRPKIQGTMNLHESTPRDVDFFILLSSITCVIGNAAQSNYAAGNTFEDAFAHFHRSQGLAATAIDVGLVTDSAHFTGDFDMDAYFQMYEHRWDGLQTTQSELDAVLKAAMRGRTADGKLIEPQIVLGLGSSMPVSPSSAGWTKDPKFSHRVSHTLMDGTDSLGKQETPAERLAQAENTQDAVSIVEEVLRGYAAQIMDIATTDIDTEKAFYDFGVDSLKAVELRNRIFRDVQSDVSVFELLSPSPLSKLAVDIEGKSKFTTKK
ncbi:PKSN polyketide synthase for alternapyrone biosynthesis protein [Colletotrichum acutatum]|uniref:PKSN polyketide synthase for alternapyrone biosynthesis protein n=1 Tax=Glomerella acutata TaxID=27357 RepID=A0AAD8XCN3_GLOAC|nr:PKSN polyketide synthase for alternapyrone biosynthesis protein [Colletotrichum acutatum]KAK1710885.1 PKSN polyketide synthase for alternapyrone biosynthesis protein [Colletotrichum acutatum]